jgi:single-strand DNA-binding protein
MGQGRLNKVFLMGNLTRDPELRRLPSGTAVTELGLALNRSYTDKNGEKHEDVTFVDVTVWDRTAENCCQYLKKGKAVHVEGYLKMDSWEDKATGEKRSKLKVQADNVQFLDRRDDGGAGGSTGAGADDEYAAPAPRRSSAPEPRSPGNGPSRGGYNNAPPAPAPAARRAPSPPVDSEEDDDIPF